MTFKIRETGLADVTLDRQDNRPPKRENNLVSDITNVWIVCAILIFSFNVVATTIALITIGTKGYDPYIHASAMLVSVLTLGCIAAIHKYILGG